jgi:hypothetical protein
MTRTNITASATLSIMTLIGSPLLVACGDEPQPLAASAGSSASTGTTTGPVSVSGGAGASAVAGGSATPAVAGSKAPPVTTVAGTNGSVGSAGSAGSAGGSNSAAAGAAAGAAPAAMSAGAGGNATAAAGSGGAAVAQPAGAACDPKDMMPEPEAVSYKVIVGYDMLAEAPTTGPINPVIEVHPGFPEWTVYRPETLNAETKHPIVIFGNGGCLLNGTLFGQWTLELASYGIVSVVDGTPAASASGDPAANGIRPGPDGEPMVMAMDWIIAENERPCSPFYHRLAIDKVGLAGQSCGGMMTMMAAGDKRISTAMVFNSGLSSNDATLFSSYHAPMLFLAGGPSDFLTNSATSNVAAITTVPIWYGNLDVGHMSTWDQTNAGEMGRVATGWVRWQLQGDAAMEKWFVGADCELCKPPSMWEVTEKKMID